MSEAQNFNKDVSLDEYVLTHLIVRLEAAMDAFLDGDFERSLLNADIAYFLSVPALGERKRPSVQLRDKIELAPAERSKNWNQYLRDARGLLTLFDSGFLSPKDALLAKAEELYFKDVWWTLLNQFATETVSKLQAKGLYLGSSRVIVPSADLKTKVEPPLEKLPTVIKR
jgi:hypothetical protein